jgi:FkbM family methyltransferase
VEPEEPVQEHLAELFARTGPECVLDVGANTGQYGTLLRAHGYQGWIVSFEPVAGAFEQLSELAGRDRGWRVFPLALGARTERRRIAVAEVSQLSSFRTFSEYASTELPGASDVTHTEEVDIGTLNDVWNESLRALPRSRVFLKLDTQGWDLEVLKGANEVLERLVGLQLEASLTPIYEGVPTFAQTVEHVAGLGFDLTGVFPVNRGLAVPFDRGGLRLHQLPPSRRQNVAAGYVGDVDRAPPR